MSWRILLSVCALLCVAMPSSIEAKPKKHGHQTKKDEPQAPVDNGVAGAAAMNPTGNGDNKQKAKPQSRGY